VSGQKNRGSATRTLNLVREARKEGLDDTIDQYPYTASTTNLHALLPAWAMAGGTDSANFRLLDTVIRNKIKAEMSNKATRIN